MARAHLLHPARAGRRGGPGGAVELPDDDGRLEVRARAGGGQHGRAQAVRHDARPRRTGWSRSCRRSSRRGAATWCCGDRDTGAALIAHPIPRMVSITGSIRAGIAVATAAAADVKRVHLELGGKAPVRGLRRRRHRGGGRGHRGGRATSTPGRTAPRPTGSSCQDGVYDEFVAALAEQAKRVTRTGYDPADEDILYGPINNVNQLAPGQRIHRPGARPRPAARRRPAAGRARLLLRADA